MLWLIRAVLFPFRGAVAAWKEWGEAAEFEARETGARK